MRLGLVKIFWEKPDFEYILENSEQGRETNTISTVLFQIAQFKTGKHHNYNNSINTSGDAVFKHITLHV